ncbi:hypothetical protein Naga_100453g4 [Nannochloropsis gaditana]|uniref:Uncharacterized protein n=1 Tax=Nannochloropsis gaditana TaxID=72520 RepID=W7U362_9STRA|nr:hypothetical protein Naga_100453g4 [Nannochloropsis gaditana]
MSELHLCLSLADLSAMRKAPHTSVPSWKERTSITIASTLRPCFRGATDLYYRKYGLYDMASLQARNAHGNHIFDCTLKRFRMKEKEADDLHWW